MLIIHSEAAYQRELRTFEKRLEKERDRNAKDLKHLNNDAFACEDDAEKAAQRFAKRLRHQQFTYTVYRRNRYTTVGRPAADATPDSVQWYVRGTLTDDIEAIEKHRRNE